MRGCVPTAHGDQKRSVTFTETQSQQAAPSATEPPGEGRKASPAPSKSPTLEVPSVASATVTADLHGPVSIQVGRLEGAWEGSRLLLERFFDLLLESYVT